MPTKRDKSGVIEKIAREIIKKEFPVLRNINLLYTWRIGKPRPGDDGKVVAGRARILPSWPRDCFNYHAEIEISKTIWDRMGKRDRKRLIDHELNHIGVETDENDNVITDKEGNPRLAIVDHDLSIQTFSRECMKHGISESDLPMFKKIHDIYRKYKKGKLKLNKRFEDGEVEVTFD